VPKHIYEDDGDPRRYWSQIPNIVYDIGLTPNEVALYSHMKRAAGASESGKCSKSTRTLAAECGMSVTVVIRTKASLAKPRRALNNKPLIRITEQPTGRGGQPQHIIRIVDIWPENTAKYAPVGEVEQVPQVELGQVPQNRVASSISTENQVPQVEQKNNHDQEKPEEQLSARARGKPRKPGSFDEANDKSPRFGVELIRVLPDEWLEEQRILMRQKFPTLEFTRFHDKWCQYRFRDGIGRRGLRVATLVQYAADIDIFFGNCLENDQRRNGHNGNGNQPKSDLLSRQSEIAAKLGVEYKP